MDQHSVPRNISGFQFHLIGDMTLRQFGYLVAGAACAFIAYKISPLPTILKYPFAGMFAFAGVAFAFLPIQERPLDRWVIAFIKSIYSPTQFIWQKEGMLLEILSKPISSPAKILSQNHTQAHQDAKTKLNQYLSTLPQSPHQTLNLREKSYIDQTLALFDSTAGTQPAYPAKPKVVINSVPKQVPTRLAEAFGGARASTPTQPVTEPIPSQAAKQSDTQTDAEQYPTPNITPLIKNEPPQPAPFDYAQIQKQLAELSDQKESLAKELAKLRSEIKKIEEPLIIKPELGQEEKKAPSIKSVSAQSAVNEIGMPAIPQTPNVISGVIRDSQKKLLPNIILTIKDGKGNLIRALKTNKLGQFATATPLSNGTYLIEVEDPLKRYAFDIAQISLSGKIILPIVIGAKGEKELLREKLTKELFGSSST